MATIYHQIIVQAELKVIYEAITSQEGLSNWWIKECDVKAEKGYINTFKVEGYPLNKMKVKKLKPFTKVEWKCLDGHKKWIGTKISFSISEGKSGSILKFKHSKWKKQSDFFATCNFHWARHLIILQNYCENGFSSLDESHEKEEIKKVKTQK